MTPAGPNVASRSWYSEPAKQFLGREFYLFWVSEVDVCSKCDFGELDHAGYVVVTQYVSWVEPPGVLCRDHGDKRALRRFGQESLLSPTRSILSSGASWRDWPEVGSGRNE